MIIAWWLQGGRAHQCCAERVVREEFYRVCNAELDEALEKGHISSTAPAATTENQK